MDLLIQDVRYALRRLSLSPLFTVMAVLIIGVGIAANTAVFSAVNAILLRPLPFDQPDRVVHVYQDSDEGQPQSSSFPAYQAIAARTDVFSEAAAIFYTTTGVETDSGIRQALVEFASSSYFAVLGLRPTRGRWIAPEEDAVAGPAAAVVSYHAWQTRFGSDPGIVGRTFRLGGSPVTVVGVGPRAYNSFANGVAVDFWLSLSSVAPVVGRFGAATFQRPQDHWFFVRARLRDGVSVAQAQAAMKTLSAELGTRYAGLDQVRGITVISASDVRIHPAFDRALLPAATLLMGVVGLVLALVCSNLAILVLLRGTAQDRDVSIRIAMGASRRRIVRQFLTESLVLALAGGVLGYVAAAWLVGLVSAVDIPATNGQLDFTIDYRVLAFATIVSLVTGVAFGLGPALRSVRTDVRSVLGGIGSERRRIAVKYTLVGFQVALSLVLLAGSGLFIRSMLQMERVNIGFPHERFATITTSAGQAGYQPPQARRLYDDLEARIAALPGVEAVSRTARPPLGGGPTSTLVIEEYVSPGGTNIAEVEASAVAVDYFDTLGVRLLQGRAFGPRDDAEAPAVAIVSEAMARRYWGTVNVVGRRYRHDGAPDSWVEIVGVAANVKVRSVTEDPQPLFYRPVNQVGAPVSWFLVRTSGNPAGMIGTLSRTVRDLDPRLPILQASTMDDYLGRQLVLPRIGAGILTGFSVAALALAALGLYAVVAFAVGGRSREIGIRMALGARAPHVLWVMLRGVAATIAVGLAAGLLLALGSAQAFGAVLYSVSPTDPLTLVAVTLVLALVALAAACIPARRATRVNPVVVLRYQ